MWERERERLWSLEAGFGELAPRGAGLPLPRALQFGLRAPRSPQSPPLGWPHGPAGSPGGPRAARIWRNAGSASPPRCGLDGRGRGDMEPSPATGGSETTRLVSPRDRSSAGGGLRLKR